MSPQINVPIPILHGSITANYLISPKHRAVPTVDVCVWSINLQEEVDCFERCLISNWISGEYGWGISIANGSLPPIAQVLTCAYHDRRYLPAHATR